jgi:hypothetical protein
MQFPFEEVPTGLAAYTEGLGPPVETKRSGKRLQAKDIMDASSGNGPVTYKASIANNDLAELAFQLATEEYGAMSEEDQKGCEIGTLAISHFNRLCNEREKKLASRPSPREVTEVEVKQMNKFIRVERTSNQNKPIPYELGLPGLMSEPATPEFVCKLTYFLATGVRTSTSFEADWVLEQEIDSGRLTIVVLDGRRPDVVVPEVPHLGAEHDNTANLLDVAYNGENVESYTVSQGFLRLDIGKLILLVFGE